MTAWHEWFTEKRNFSDTKGVRESSIEKKWCIRPWTAPPPHTLRTWFTTCVPVAWSPHPSIVVVCANHPPSFEVPCHMVVICAGPCHHMPWWSQDVQPTEWSIWSRRQTVHELHKMPSRPVRFLTLYALVHVPFSRQHTYSRLDSFVCGFSFWSKVSSWCNVQE